MKKIKCVRGTETVTTAKELSKALKKRQQRIIIKGELAETAYKKIDQFATKSIVKTVGTVICAAGTLLVNPLMAIPGLYFLTGKDDNLMLYIMVEYSARKVIIELKDEVQKEAHWVLK